VKVGDIWMRRQSAKFNGVSYITQKAALAVYSKEAQNEISECISYYKKNSKLISETLDELNIWNIGGKNSPYIWLKCPHKMSSWEFFDCLLKNAEIVGTPGSGFGPNGEGFFRISSFGSHEKTFEAVERLKLLKI
jgi:LL-diaminopimelate aminotransferase